MPSMTLEKEEQLQIRPASEHVGADITDVNLAASLSNGAFEKIEGRLQSLFAPNLSWSRAEPGAADRAATFGFAARPFSCRSTTCTCSPRRCAVRTARRLEQDMKIHTPKAGLAMKLLLRRAEADAILG